MPSKRAKMQSDSADLTRSERLLALILLHALGESGQQKKALTLRAAGLSNTNIAEMLGTSADVIAQVLYQARSKKTKSKKFKTKRARRK